MPQRTTGSRGPRRRPSRAVPTSRPRRRNRRPLQLATGPFRLWSAFLAIAFVFSLFAARLIQLQGIDASDYAAMAEAQGATTVTLEAPRAPIYDRSGFELARTVNAAKLVADPTYTTAHAIRIAAFLHRKLGLDYFSTLALLRKRGTRYVELAGHLEPHRAAAIVNQLNRANLPGVFSDKDTMRVYPSGDVAANIVGYLQTGGGGLGGIEASYNSLLAGHNGSMTYEVADGQQLPLAPTTTIPPKEGTGVKLTIDQDLQFLAQRRLAQAVRTSGGLSGVAIIMDVRTGQILALADYPTFNPNERSRFKPTDYGSRAIQDVYEPGSVEKVLTFASLIDAGYVTPRTKITVPPTLTRGSHVIHDYFTHGTLHLTATGVIAESSNIGTVLASEQMPGVKLYHYLRSFGLGSPTGLPLGGEAAGLLPPASGWQRLTHDTISFGQGLSVNAVQMAAAIGAVANGGVYVQPSLVEGFVSHDGHFTPAKPPTRHRVVSARAAHDVARMMEDVTGPNGTAPYAAIKGYRVAGKTGTAQRVGPKCACYNGTFTVSFAGFAPADKPRFLAYIVVQRPTNGGGGGSIGGPVFHDLMAATLEKYGVPPTGRKAPALPMTW